MRLNSDLREFIELLNSRGVEYLIVGAYSFAFHARPRFTGDVDILLRPTRVNAERIVAVLKDFGFDDLAITPGDFTKPEQVIQLGRVKRAQKFRSVYQRADC